MLHVSSNFQIHLAFWEEADPPEIRTDRMDDLDVLARGYGFRPQGKSNPMRSDGGDRRSSSARSTFTVLYDDDHSSRGGDGMFFNEFYGGTPKYTTSSNSNNGNSSSMMNDFDYDSIFNSTGAPAGGGNSNNPRTSAAPVYDKPVYDDDIFNGLPGMKSKSVSSAPVGRFEDEGFASVASSTGWDGQGSNSNSRHDEADDLLGKLGSQRENSKISSTSAGFDFLGDLTRNEPVHEGKSSNRSSGSRGFDDLLGGFGSGSPANSNRYLKRSLDGVI